ncbi:MAG: hypothetical protein V2A65_06620 [Candidatus Omnitrophota bacterium]
MKKLFLVTVDCDMRIDRIDVREESLQVLFRTFREYGLAGHVTWFLNENDFNLTGNHQEFLKQAIKAEDSIGIHDHVDRIKTLKKDNLKEFFQQSKLKVEGFFKKNRLGEKNINIHRTGCAVQNPEIYAALKELNYRIVSDVVPGEAGSRTDQSPGFDNRLIPEGIRPYLHNEADYFDYRTSILITPKGITTGIRKPLLGHFIQVPIAHIYLALDFDKVARWLKISEAIEFTYPATSGKNPAVVTWVFHPYEILNTERTKISAKKVNLLQNQLNRLEKELHFLFVSMDECVAEFKILYEEGWK